MKQIKYNTFSLRKHGSPWHYLSAWRCFSLKNQTINLNTIYLTINRNCQTSPSFHIQKKKIGKIGNFFSHQLRGLFSNICYCLFLATGCGGKYKNIELKGFVTWLFRHNGNREKKLRRFYVASCLTKLQDLVHVSVAIYRIKRQV